MQYETLRCTIIIRDCEQLNILAVVFDYMIVR
jgi:hypothetical protein